MIKRPMKGAAVEDYEDIRFPCWGMPKIDGFRCILSDIAMTSRLSPFPNKTFNAQTRGIASELPYPIDGEIVVGKKRGKGVLGRTSSGLTSKEGDPDWRLWVFDVYAPGIPWPKRYELAQDCVTALENSRIRLLKRQRLNNYAEFVIFLAWALANGYEGVVTRSDDGDYKEGKSTLRQQWLLKVKPFETFEFRITGYYEEEANGNEAQKDATGKTRRSSSKSGKTGKGTLGGFTGVELGTGKPVRCGGGFTAEQRKQLWTIRDQLVKDRTLVRGKKQVAGEKDAPRHPSFVDFVDFRPEWDMTDD